MSTPRKHHYLPQFYLEGFEIEPQRGKNPHIWQIEKSADQAYSSPAIKDTGCVRDYHSVDFTNEEPDHKTVENLLSKIEAEQADLVRTIKKTKRVDASQVESLSVFISLMRYRVPVFAAHIEKSIRSVVLDTFKMMYRAGGFRPPPPQLRKMFDTKGIDDSLHITISNWKILGHMFQLGLAPESVGSLAEYNYHIYSAENASFFITSDNPVALYHANYDEIRPYGVGLAMKGVEVTIPLSSDTLIRAGRELTPGNSVATPAEVDEFNRRTIVMSERYIFASVLSMELTRRIGELKDVKAGFAFGNLFYGDGSVHVSRFIPVQ